MLRPFRSFRPFHHGASLLILALTVVSPALAAAAPAPGGKAPMPIAAVTPPPGNTPGACIFPTTIVGGFAQTAWMLFVAANCPTKTSQLVWETWIEQTQLYPPASGGGGGVTVAQGAGSGRLHASPLARATSAIAATGVTSTARAVGSTLMSGHGAGKVVNLDPGSQCNTMQSPPSNVVKGATVCEEVHVNPAAEAFIQGAGYQLRSGQIKAANLGTDIQFPIPSVEVKVDWIPATDFNPPFTCAKPPAGVHVETIDGACYAMGGIHILSKVMPNWLWVTFEPQNLQTNPNRCITFGECNDPYGSNPAISHGGVTALTSEVETLMTQAGLAPEFFNYRLDGIQVDFGTTENPSILGNSIIEGENAGLNATNSSCITCHSVSSIGKDGTDGFDFLNNQVGPQYVPPANYIARDFVWSLALACPGGLCP
jgi:hypothetical protein